MQIIQEITATASQANNPDSLIGWGIPDYEKALLNLSVPEKPAEATLVTYPNPVQDRMTIGFPSLMHGTIEIEMYNLEGKTVYTTEAKGENLRSLQLNDLGNLQSGIYMLRAKNSSVVYSGKVMKL